MVNIMKAAGKLSDLLRKWPAGTVATQSWLSKNNIYYQLAEKYIKGGWLEKVGNAAFKRAGDKVDWRGVVYAVQHSGDKPIHVGGITALDLRGLSHFIYKGKPKLQLFNTDQKHSRRLLPKWLVEYLVDEVHITYIRNRLFTTDIGLIDFSCHSFEIKVSSIERALLEAISLVPGNISFEHAYYLMLGKHTLRANLLQQLLKECTSYQTKRVFLYLAKRCELSFLQNLNISDLNLGNGKRKVAGEGELEYDSALELEVPKLKLDTDNDMEILF
jgi:hypothetical protein